MNYYWPVSLTSICCKFMEAIIRDSLMKYLEFNKLLSEYLKKRSTVIHLQKILDKWTECLDSGGKIDVVHTDLEKTFDKVSQKRLISKLESFAVNKDL